MHYTMNIAGLKRDLPLCRVNDDLYIGAFVIFGDVELTVACARELLKIAPEHDILITAESKGIPLIHEMARQTGEKRYVLARKSVKLYMKDVRRVDVTSITTANPQTLYVDGADAEYMKGKRVLIVDDVISTGESLKAVEKLVKQAGGNVVGKMAILAEGDATERDDLIYLEKLPLFDGIPLNADDGYRTIPGLVFLPRLQMNGGRLAMEVAEDRSVTLIDLKTAQRIPVEGYTLPQRQALHQTTVTVSNPSGTRLLVAACEPGHIFSHDNIAVLGLDGGFLLERSGLDPEVLERDITWLDDDRFVILCQVENDHYAVTGSWFYIYDLSEKNDNAE